METSSKISPSEGTKKLYEIPSGVGGFNGIFLLSAVIISSITVVVAAPIYLPTPQGVPDYISLSVAFFALLMLFELMLTRGRVYDMADSASSISAGALQQLFALVFIKRLGLGLIPYMWIYNNYGSRIFPMDSWIEWTAIILSVDFAYYWFHRFSHEFQPFWWGHVVHHSSEFYNLSTALRQGALQTPCALLVYLPLAFFFPPKLFLVHNQLNTLYQFWVHTQCIGKLGFLEYILMTPSGHRVHHDRRVHKNYGGFLVVWDRLFGSYAEEQIVPSERSAIYGVLNTPNSWNPLFCQVHQLLHTLKTALRMPGLYAKWRVLTSGPGARDMSSRTVLPVAPNNAPNHRYRSMLSKRQIFYCLIHLAAAVVMINICMVWHDITTAALVAFGTAGVISLASIGMLNDRHPQALVWSCSDVWQSLAAAPTA